MPSTAGRPRSATTSADLVVDGVHAGGSGRRSGPAARPRGRGPRGRGRCRRRAQLGEALEHALGVAAHAERRRRRAPHRAAARAGASSSRIRSRMTGTWRSRAGPRSLMVRPSHARAGRWPRGAPVGHGAGVTGADLTADRVRPGAGWWWPTGWSAAIRWRELSGAGRRSAVGCGLLVTWTWGWSPSAASPGTGEVVPGVERLEAGTQVLFGRRSRRWSAGVVVVGGGGRPGQKSPGITSCAVSAKLCSVCSR